MKFLTELPSQIRLHAERSSQLDKCIVHLFGDYFGIGKEGKEVRVAVPSRNNMEMDMVNNSRSGSAPHIAPDVDAISIHLFAKNGGELLQKLHCFKQFIVGEVADVSCVPVRDNHHVSAIVRI